MKHKEKTKKEAQRKIIIKPTPEIIAQYNECAEIIDEVHEDSLNVN